MNILLKLKELILNLMALGLQPRPAAKIAPPTQCH